MSACIGGERLVPVNYISGFLDVELTSADLHGALASLNAAGTDVLHLQYVSELTVRFRVSRKGFTTLKKLTEKRGESLHVLHQNGLLRTAAALLRRPICILMIFSLFVSAVILPGRVLFVEVIGNTLVPSRRILETAQSHGIVFGASRREVRSEKIKNAILSEIPQLQWVGVNTAGCVATVSVRERPEEITEPAENMVTSIVAARDGYILSGTATQGNVCFQVGQSVKEGQVLISGYTDCGICIQATRSAGEIMAQTRREITAVTPGMCLIRGDMLEESWRIGLILGKKRINLWNSSGIYPTTCGRMYKEYCISLPGGFRLPVVLSVERIFSNQVVPYPVDENAAADILNCFTFRYLPAQMIAGEVQNAQQDISVQDGLFLLRGEYVCVEMIGREQREEIGDAHGKTSGTDRQR